ncbi:hypothetical protein FDECE_3758 [Fusarium decemcellulare]|nr:hypothetical protein FDECE_3758 [Fusarium decemcellulare]
MVESLERLYALLEPVDEPAADGPVATSQRTLVNEVVPMDKRRTFFRRTMDLASIPVQLDDKAHSLGLTMPTEHRTGQHCRQLWHAIAARRAGAVADEGTVISAMR